MSLTSYRAAPPRDTVLRRFARRVLRVGVRRGVPGLEARGRQGNGFCVCTQAAMPGDALLFHCLGSSTIGAVGFHGRVRDGIGWDTDAMATRQWSLWAH